MSKVLSLKEDSFDGSDGTRVVCWKVELDDRTQPVPCYSAEASKLKVGEPLPEGWSVQVSKKGKDYLQVPKAPKGFGGQASWYNSEAGVRFTQERMDRRTALMQAVETKQVLWEHWVNSDEPKPQTMPFVEWKSLAKEMYEWLRETSGGPSTGAARETTTDSKAATTSEETGMGKAQPPERSEGEGDPTTGVEGSLSPKDCPHAHTSPLRPDGSEMPINKLRCLDCGTAVKA